MWKSALQTKTKTKTKDKAEVAIYFRCDLKDQTFGYGAFENVKGEVNSLGIATAKFSLYTIPDVLNTPQQQTYREIINVFLAALYRGKLRSKAKKRQLEEKDFDWPVFLFTQGYSKISTLPRPEQLMKELAEFDWIRNFFEFLQQNEKFASDMLGDTYILVNTNEKQLESLREIFEWDNFEKIQLAINEIIRVAD